MIAASAFIHPLAVVETNCNVYGGAKIWQFASVSRGAHISKNVVVAPGAMIDGSFIGDDSKVGPGVKMGPGFLVGSNVFLGPNVVLCNDAFPRAHVEGWDISKFLDRTYFAVIIDDGASVGANATILPGVRLGARCFVAAGAVVDRDVPADTLYKRDGSLVPINTAWARRRMKAAR